MNHSSAPSLLSGTGSTHAHSDAHHSANTLLDLMYDGFYALFLLKNRCAPKDEADFAAKMQRFLTDFSTLR